MAHIHTQTPSNEEDNLKPTLRCHTAIHSLSRTHLHRIWGGLCIVHCLSAALSGRVCLCACLSKGDLRFRLHVWTTFSRSQPNESPSIVQQLQLPTTIVLTAPPETAPPPQTPLHHQRTQAIAVPRTVASPPRPLAHTAAAVLAMWRGDPSAVAAAMHAMCASESGAATAGIAARLPDNVLEVIFVYLDLGELRQCAQVCRNWHRYLSDENNDVWRMHCLRRLADEALKSELLVSVPTFKAKLRALHHAWNPNDCSPNVYVKPNGFTLHR